MTTSPANEFQTKLRQALYELAREARIIQDMNSDPIILNKKTLEEVDIAYAAINELIKEEIEKGRDIFLTTDDTDPILSEDYMANKAVKVRDTFRQELLTAFGLSGVRGEGEG